VHGAPRSIAALATDRCFLTAGAELLGLGARRAIVVERLAIPSREHDFAEPAPLAADGSKRGGRGWFAAVAVGQCGVEIGEDLDGHQGLAQGGAPAKALGVPARVLAKRSHGQMFGGPGALALAWTPAGRGLDSKLGVALSVPGDHRFGVGTHDPGDDGEARRLAWDRAAHELDELGE